MKTRLLKFFLPVVAIGSGYAANAQTTLYSTITGKVWQETNTNGIIDVGEGSISGTLIELHKIQSSTDTIVSAAVTDTSGHYTLENYKGTGQYYILYRFPSAGYTITTRRVGTNDTLNSAAYSIGTVSANRGISDTFSISSTATLKVYNLGLAVRPQRYTYCSAAAFASTTWSQTVSLPQANPSIGALGSAVLFTDEAVKHPSFGIENTNLNNSVAASLEFAGRLEVEGDVLPQPVILNTQITKSENLPLYDGILDYAGISGRTWNNEFSSAFSSYTETDPVDYIGTGSLAFPVTAQSVSTVIGGGNMQNYVTTNVAAGVCITYIYTTVLPVSLTGFDAIRREDKIYLQWTTASEVNNKGFSVERSTDGKDFAAIGFVNAKTGDEVHTGKSQYDFWDDQPLIGKNIYRLKQIDNDGQYHYSFVRIVDGLPASGLQIYPNPSQAKLVVENIEKDSRINVFNSAGQRMNVTISQQNGGAEIETQTLPDGAYLLYIIQNNTVLPGKFMVRH